MQAKTEDLGRARPPVKPSASPSVAVDVAAWIEEHPTARGSTKELYPGLLRTCISPTLGRSSVSGLTPAGVRRWHHALGERLAADADRRRADLQAKGWKGSAAPGEMARQGRRRRTDCCGRRCPRGIGCWC